MLDILLPNFTIFSSVMVFLKIYSPTRLYLNNLICSSVAMVFSFFSDYDPANTSENFYFIFSSFVFALICSIPYWLGGMLGSVMQQMLVLNEQSVQDKRFTEESEALGQISSIIFLIYALKSGLLFKPILDLYTYNANYDKNLYFDDFYYLIVDSFKAIVILSSKYIVIFVITVISGGYIDLFFSKTSVSSTVSQNCVPILAVTLMTVWFLSDQKYIFNMLMKKIGYIL